jgi:hypothetical protein
VKNTNNGEGNKNTYITVDIPAMTSKSNYITTCIFVWAALLPIQCIAQQFSLLHDLNHSPDWGKNIFENNGEYIVIGGNLKNGWGISYWGFSHNGKTVLNDKIWRKAPNSFYAGTGKAGGVVKINSNNEYVIPTTIEYPLSSDFRLSAGLIVLDPYGDTVFTRAYTDTSKYHETFSSCALLPGGYVMAGYRELLGAGTPGRSGMLVTTDNMGNLLWTKTYGNMTDISTVEILDNNNILLGGEYAVIVWIKKDYYYKRMPVFKIVDGVTGNTIKDTVYTSGYSGGGSICIDKNGGYFHWGQIDSAVNGFVDAYSSFPDYIAHLNNKFEIDRIDTLTPWIGHNYISKVKQLEDSSYFLMGTAISLLPPYNGTGWAAQMDKHWKLLWDNTYVVDSDYHNYLVDGVQLPEGGFVFTGSARTDSTSDTQKENLWLLRVDSNGCLIPGCEPTFIKEPLKAVTCSIDIYPNPNNGRFTLKTTENGRLYIYNIQGSEVLSCNVNKREISLDLPGNIAHGVYFMRFVNQQQQTIVLRLIYQP